MSDQTTPLTVLAMDRGKGDDATVKVAYRREGGALVIVAMQTLPARAAVVWPAGGKQ